jgi:hypothetical protein
MSLVRLERHENLVTVRLSNGTTNAVSPDLIDELSETLTSQSIII